MKSKKEFLAMAQKLTAGAEFAELASMIEEAFDRLAEVEEYLAEVNEIDQDTRANEGMY